jgi:hypothetical protein
MQEESVKKLFFLVAGGVALVVAAITASPASAVVWTQASNPAQSFNPSIAICIGVGTTNPNSPGVACSGTETLLLGAAPTVTTAVRLPGGTRQSLVFGYVGPGWRWEGHGLAAVGTGVTVGGIKSSIDLFCDGSIDVFSDGSSTGDPATDALSSGTFVLEPAVTKTTAWDTTSGPGDQPNEEFLDKVLPTDTSIMDREYRSLALADTVFLPGPVSNPITPNAPINSIGMSLDWTGNNTLLTATFLAGGVASPGTSKNCLDSPQNSISTASGAIAGNPARAGGGAGADADANGVDDNTGYYPRWSVFVSALDVVNSDLQGTLILNCKYVSANFPGGASEVAAPGGSDSDGDCLEDAATAEPGRPTDTDDTVSDVDGDGIVDGIEVAWGSSPPFIKTETNLTVIAGPFAPGALGVVLTVDSTTGLSVGDRVDVYDGAGNWVSILVTALTATSITGDVEKTSSGGAEGPFPIGSVVAFQPGIVVNGSPTYAGDLPDMDGDLRSDLEELMATGNNLSNPTKADTDGDGVNDGGIAWDDNDDGTPDVILGAGSMQTLAGGGSSPAKVYASFHIPGGTKTPTEGDNCTNIANPLQENSDSGRPAGTGTADRTNPDEDSTGDACESDNDNDGLNDLAELINKYNAPGPNCSISTGTAAVTDATKADTDGDRQRDGVECQEGLNPLDSASKHSLTSCSVGPLALESCGSDNDGIGLKTERIERTTGINQAEGSGLACGAGQLCDIDLGRVATDGNVLGTSNIGESDKDSDADGIDDGIEYFIWGTSPANMDSDADGCPDGIEIVSVDGLSGAATGCQVGFNDFTTLLAVFNTNSASGTWNNTSAPLGGKYVDWTGDNAVGFPDFLLLLSMYNKNVPSTDAVEP